VLRARRGGRAVLLDPHRVQLVEPGVDRRLLRGERRALRLLGDDEPGELRLLGPVALRIASIASTRSLRFAAIWSMVASRSSIAEVSAGSTIASSALGWPPM